MIYDLKFNLRSQEQWIQDIYIHTHTLISMEEVRINIVSIEVWINRYFNIHADTAFPSHKFLTSICNISVGSAENSTYCSLRKYNRITRTEFKEKKKRNLDYISISQTTVLSTAIPIYLCCYCLLLSFSLHSYFPEKALSSGGFRGKHPSGSIVPQIHISLSC